MFLPAVLALIAFTTTFRPHPKGLFRSANRGVASLQDAPRGEDSALRSKGHSHNDYERDMPLEDALRRNLSSVEADIWLKDGELWVSHLGWFFSGKLEELYLKPLQRRVEAQGAVSPRGRDFYLWLDIKDRNPELVNVLHRVLARYPMLSRFTHGASKKGAVTVILTGFHESKRRYVEDFQIRFALRDSWAFRSDDPELKNADDPWQWYALNWFRYMDWNGEGEIPPAEALKLQALVKAIHEKGRRIRFWGAPNTEGVWAASMLAGVDLIGADDIEGVSALLDQGGN